MPLKVVFMGTPAFSVPTLRAVVNAGHPAPLCRRKAESVVEPLAIAKSSMPFGIRSNERFHPVHVLLQQSCYV